MRQWIGGISSDAGNVKKVNQDAVLLVFADTARCGQVVFSALCDGMGGLSGGELASNTLVKALESWFHEDLPLLLSHDTYTTELSPVCKSDNDLWVSNPIKHSLAHVLDDVNHRILHYGYEHGISLGTTFVGLLILDSQWLCVNVGDSRCYHFNESLRLITHDHSWIQQQIDRGEMTVTQAMQSPEQSILLQCIGASETICPDFFHGDSALGDSFLLCSDGFWRQSTPPEIREILSCPASTDEALCAALNQQIVRLMERGEKDNISAIIVTDKGTSHA